LGPPLHVKEFNAGFGAFAQQDTGAASCHKAEFVVSGRQVAVNLRGRDARYDGAGKTLLCGQRKRKAQHQAKDQGDGTASLHGMDFFKYRIDVWNKNEQMSSGCAVKGDGVG
jgi:hypothetical protein